MNSFKMESYIKTILRRFGLEVRRYNVSTSDDARLRCILDGCGIDLVLDVGANAGQYGQKLRRLGYCGHIISFEPLSSVYALLLQNSGGDSLWSVAPRMAIGSDDGEITINISKNSYSSSVLSLLPAHAQAAPESNYIGTEEVAVRTLDSLWGSVIPKQFKSIYLKMDVQGYEDKVLGGAKHILEKVRGIQTELSLVPLYEGQKLSQEMVHYIQGLGFELFSILTGFVDPITARTLQFDGVFLR